MIAKEVKKCTIFTEFSGKEKHDYFDFKKNTVLHHIDTYYYAVYINEPENVVELQRNNTLPESLKLFLNKLRDMKSYVKGNVKKNLQEIAGMEAAAKAFSIYEFCISLNECFDIFIASSLLNEDTPRIVVQIRSRYLVLEGVWEAIKKSYTYLCDFLQSFELFPVKLGINRIDYAFHTNCIENPAKYFSDYKLKKHCKTTLNVYGKIGKTDSWTIDTFNLGSRRSNSLFFRAYDKTREVIEMNYKSFFIERWLQNGLISKYDAYVYNVAYEMKSYSTGILVGRIKWYLEFGKDEDLKDKLKDLLQTCYVNSDNSVFIKQQIDGVLPEPRVVCNIEFQTKRAFYTSCIKWMHSIPEDIKIYDEVKLSSLVLDEEEKVDPIFDELYFFLRNGKIVVDYLTSYGKCVSFVPDATMTVKEFLSNGKKYLFWWKRIRECNIDYSGEVVGQELIRSNEQRASVRRTRRMLQSQIAKLSILTEQDTKVLPFAQDVLNSLSTLNDNDKCQLQFVPDDNGEIFEPKEYSEIRDRKARQLKSIVKHKKILGNY